MKTAFFQMDTVWEQPAWNIDKAEKWVEGLPEDVDLCILPEMFATGFSMNPVRVAQYMDGQIVTRMQALAVRSGKALIFSAAICAADHKKCVDQFYNRLFFMAPDGVRFVYDKRHLFRMSGEDQKYTAGNQRLIINYKGWRLFPLICYDLRFPAWSRAAKDADLLIYIASWPAQRSYAWDTLLRARAIENQCYTIGVNRVGDDPKNHYLGASMALDFLGQPIAKANDDTECALIVNLDLQEQNKFREQFPAALDADNIEIL